MKNMKRFSAVVGAAALVAVAFTGCKNSFAGTELNYSEKESEKVGTSSNLKNLASTSTADIEVEKLTDVSSQGKASSRTSIKVTITNNATNTNIDFASAKNAITFYSLTNNGNNYAKRDAALTKTLHSEKEINNKKAEFEFEVNTSSIATSDIAVYVDATKLKDKQGTLILNDDGNYKRGEDTDHVIKYLTVDASKTATTGKWETYHPTWTPLGNPSVAPLADTAGKLTGEFEVRIAPSAYSQESATAAQTVNKTFAPELSSSRVLRIRKPGSTSTETKALTFSYDETRGYYKASAGNLEPGTHYDVVTTNKDISAKAPAWYVEFYGHKAFISDDAFGSKTSTGERDNTSVATVYVTSPDYIVEGWQTTASTWVPQQISVSAIESAQRSFLSTTRSADKAYFTVTIAGYATANPIELDAYSDFKIIDTNGNVEAALPYKVTVKKNDADATYSDRVARLEFEITNKAVALNNPVLYVGPGVTVKSNPVNGTQKKFGKFKDAADGIHSGYVALN